MAAKTPKTPTAQGISRLLAAAGFTRAVSKLRGGRSGFSVSKHGTDSVEVRYASVTMGTPDSYRYVQLAKYVTPILLAGYAVETDLDIPRLIVTAEKEG